MGAARRVMLLLDAGILAGILGERRDREDSGQDERSEKQSGTRIRARTLQITPLLIQDWPGRAERCNREANRKLPWSGVNDVADARVSGSLQKIFPLGRGKNYNE